MGMVAMITAVFRFSCVFRPGCMNDLREVLAVIRAFDTEIIVKNAVQSPVSPQKLWQAARHHPRTCT